MLRTSTRALFTTLLLLPMASAARADFIVGPGPIDAHSHAGSPDAINVDLSAPITLPAGTYLASHFNYQFLNGAGADFTVAGSVAPILAVSLLPDFSDVRPIA